MEGGYLFTLVSDEKLFAGLGGEQGLAEGPPEVRESIVNTKISAEGLREALRDEPERKHPREEEKEDEEEDIVQLTKRFKRTTL